MESSITKTFNDEDALRRWYRVFFDGTDNEPDTWNGPNSILNGFELTEDVDVYCKGEDMSEIPHTTDFDSGSMSCTGTWNDSLENLLNEFRKGSSIQITIYFHEPLVNPEDWGWRYPNPSEYVKERMADYLSRREELLSEPTQEDIIEEYYERPVDAFFRADASEYDVNTSIGEEAKEYIATLTPEQEERLVGLMWDDIMASELSGDCEVEIDKSYLRAKEEYEKIIAAENAIIFKEPFDFLH